ncbi:hypothetical protein [Virgibacillus doumboii]|uniref:hypothetical protein n=1 Tax=Virgibacillus doumboii TaxID=2697503 RepID=UPI001FE40253|nr:hypothetical protein [Virgibacillus doumboii]
MFNMKMMGNIITNYINNLDGKGDSMKKRYLASAVGAIGAGAAGYLLRNEGNRNKLKEKAQLAVDKMKNSNQENSTFEDAGVPDQAPNKDAAQLENSKMVSEGSQFGVKYYNEVKEKNK